MKKVYTVSLLLLIIVATAFTISRKKLPCNKPQQSSGYVIDTLATGLVVPWQIRFLPDGTMLFTERAGRVRILRNDKLIPKPVFIVPDVDADRKMGLLGLALHPDFKVNHFVYLANNYLDSAKMRLRVVRYTFRNDTLLAPLVIIKDIPANQNHTGCRLIFGPDKKLYITSGDADQPARAQSLRDYNGKILRVNDDGSIPADNPYVKNDTAFKQIWSYGHRNPQGLAFEPLTGVLFETEHGPTGGDEVNIIKKGNNYGWPVIHHQDARPGMVTPLMEYSPSIGPSETMFYTGNAFPELRNKLLVACLRGEGILSLTIKNDKIVDQQILFKKQFGRIRSLVTGPDGSIYVSTSMIDPPESNKSAPYDMILRVRPNGVNHNFPAQNIAGNARRIITGTGPQAIYQQLCATCHGDKLQGTERAKSLLNSNYSYGSDKASIIKNIRDGITSKGMPAWNGAISAKDIEGIADYMIAKSK
ncbi:MAG: PQQ-dependent sugar dehydrogenase [Mucilaginibacter sp.]|nr:PQQ-dependent sugar dehydrogenase [Mucilaginibacter sp.]